MLPDALSLPPDRLRFMGEDDAQFMRIAVENVELLKRDAAGVRKSGAQGSVTSKDCNQAFACAAEKKFLKAS